MEWLMSVFLVVLCLPLNAGNRLKESSPPLSFFG